MRLRKVLLGLSSLFLSYQAISQIHVSSSGSIATIAGNGIQGYAGDGGQATSAEFRTPERAVVDSAGNVYIADLGNNRVRKITASTGVISTIAGNGTSGFSGDGGPATSAELYEPYGVTLDSAGNLYISDFGNNRIRKVTTNGIISTIAGGSTSGYAGDNGPATSAKLYQPSGLAIDSYGNLYFADHGNNRIREINASTGVITTIAGNGTAGYSGDGGPGTSAELSSSYAVTVDPFGNVYISDRGANRIRMVSASTGYISTVVGNGTAGYAGDGGTSTSAEINIPSGLCSDVAGDVFFADTSNNRIRKLTVATGMISTVAGNGTDSFSGDGGLATSATLGLPQDVALDQNGNLYVVDFSNYRIRSVGAVKISPSVGISVSSSSQTYGSNPPVVSASIPNGAATVTFTSSFGWSSGAVNVVNGAASATVSTNGAHVGNYTITAAYSGNNAYLAGSASTSFTVSAASSVVSWTAPMPITYGTVLTGVQLDATASVAGTLTYNPPLGTQLSVGSQVLSVTFTPNDTTDYSSSNASVGISVVKATPSINWPTPAAVTSGTAIGSTQLNATTTVAGNFVYSPAAGYVAPLGTTTLTTTFTPNDTADYNSATANVSLSVIAAPALTLTPTTGVPGSSFTITNSDLGSTQGTSTVTINNMPATVTSWNANSIVVTVPNSLAAGTYVVAVNVNNSVAGQQNFTVIPQITGISYAQSSVPGYQILTGPPQAGFVVNGLGFGPNQTPANTVVTLGGVELNTTSWSNTQILVQVPSTFATGGSAGTLVVTYTGFNSRDPVTFQVVPAFTCPVQ